MIPADRIRLATQLGRTYRFRLHLRARVEIERLIAATIRP